MRLLVRVWARPLDFGTCCANLDKRQPMASPVNPDGCPIQSTFLQPLFSLSPGDIASLFVASGAGYIDRPHVISMFVKDLGSILAVPQHAAGVFAVLHGNPLMIRALARSAI